MAKNRRWLLDRRPVDEAQADDFRLDEAPVPDDVADGHVLVRHTWLSLDPYMRARMDDRRSYAAPQPLGAVMVGGTVGEVVRSAHPSFAPGDVVVGMGGWQEWSVVDARVRGALRPADPRIPASANLGAAGMPGVTAWYGLVRICEAAPGRTITVSAASGAVGSVVGQLAKARGARAIGIAGGPEKCAYVRDELGLDACIDHRAHPDAASLAAALAEAAPDGIDGHFENVGGPVLDAVLPNMNDFGRIAVCGLISGYDGCAIPIAQPLPILTARLRVEGFIVSDHLDVWREALAELVEGVASGAIRYRESVVEGIERAPEAFLGLLRGRNFGKQLVRLG